MYTSIQHWNCFDLWMATFLHMLLDFFESALFSVKLPSWDLAWMLWQKILDICLFKNPLAKLEQLNWVAFSKLFSTVELCLRAWKVDFAENQTSSSLLNQLNVSWVEILTPSDQMAASVQIYPFLAKTSTSVHIAPIS